MTQKGERIPGDPNFVRLICAGAIAPPTQTTARARWDLRQVAVISDWPARARMLLGIIDQFIAEIGEQRAGQWTLVQVRDAVADIAEEHGA